MASLVRCDDIHGAGFMNKLTTKNLQSIETTKVLKKTIQANRALAIVSFLID
jgi:hypothetical protein